MPMNQVQETVTFDMKSSMATMKKSLTLILLMVSLLYKNPWVLISSEMEDKQLGLILKFKELVSLLVEVNLKCLNSNYNFVITGAATTENIEPVISLTVRAYDNGIPSLDSEVLVHIFTEKVASRTMRFIVYQDPVMVDKKQDEIRYSK